MKEDISFQDMFSAVCLTTGTMVGVGVGLLAVPLRLGQKCYWIDTQTVPVSAG